MHITCSALIPFGEVTMIGVVLFCLVYNAPAAIFNDKAWWRHAHGLQRSTNAAVCA